MKLNLIEFPSSMFSWSDGGRSACCEASDMGNRHLQRLYDDAADLGFAIKSDRTGQVVKFYMGDCQKNGEGEVLSWTYRACVEDSPEANGVVITVYND